jgi:hypothetical protein
MSNWPPLTYPEADGDVIFAAIVNDIVAKIVEHLASTTNVHGITNTANLVTTAQLQELVEDYVASMFSGSQVGVSVAYNDTTGKLTFTVTADGPPGPQGEQGDPGPEGPRGPQGLPGPSGGEEFTFHNSFDTPPSESSVGDSWLVPEGGVLFNTGFGWGFNVLFSVSGDLTALGTEPGSGAAGYDLDGSGNAVFRIMVGGGASYLFGDPSTTGMLSNQTDSPSISFGGTVDPSSAGFVAEVSSIRFGADKIWKKVGPADTDWEELITASDVEIPFESITSISSDTTIVNGKRYYVQTIGDPITLTTGLFGGASATIVAHKDNDPLDVVTVTDGGSFSTVLEPGESIKISYVSGEPYLEYRYQNV